MAKKEIVRSILFEISKVIKGKDDIIEKVLMAILASGHILLEDVPGLGKTTLAMSFSTVLGLDSKRIQFTPDTMPSDIIGTSFYDERTKEFSFLPGAVMTNLLLGDEINRTSAKTQSALLEAMQEEKVTVDGVRYPLPDPFIVMATQNPITSSGTQPLPDSQLDRFMVRLSMGYPDAGAELAMLQNVQGKTQKETPTQLLDAAEVIRLRQAVNEVIVSEELLKYLIRLCDATREHEDIQLGISPRGLIAFMQMSRAHAFCQDRDYCIPEDMQAVFEDCCAHRLFLSGRARREGRSARQILHTIIEEQPVPELLRVHD